jgi:uroporphyrinogen-III synthase
LLLKGVGGRSLLAEQLCHRGAQVTELPLYQRQCCLPDARMVDEFLQAAGQHWLVLASGETLACLWQGINKAQAERLVTQCQLVVMSQRVAERAIALGWHSDQIRVAASASMSGLLATIA